MASYTRLRRVGLSERFQVTRHFLGHGTNVVMSAKYTAEDGVPLTQESLFPALRTLIETHALLSVRLEGNEASSNVTFIRLPSIDLSRIVEFSPEGDLKDTLEKQLSTNFTDTQGDVPLWRVQVLSGWTVLAVFHHATADGLSVATFHHSLLSALRDPRSQDSSSSVPAPDLPVPPSIDSVTDIGPSFRRLLSAVGTHLLPSSWTARGSTWTANDVPAMVPNLRVNVRLFTLPASNMQKLSTLCHAHHATITSVLWVLQVCALSRVLVDTKYKYLSTNVAISLRPVIGVRDTEVICHYASDFFVTAPIDTMFSWDRARRFAAELQAEKADARYILGLLRLVGNLKKFMASELGKKRIIGIQISNLGRFNAPEEGNWRIEDIFFGQADVVAGAGLSINVVGDPSGTLNIAFTWGETSLESGFVERFIKSFQDELYEILV
ncbi:alcohol acetyltransferase [Mycena epipterygia]|nr:alcohol acetyltransferase [Mycena epipterygia]